jgi:hypothetical protein
LPSIPSQTLGNAVVELKASTSVSLVLHYQAELFFLPLSFLLEIGRTNAFQLMRTVSRKQRVTACWTMPIPYLHLQIAATRDTSPSTSCVAAHHL